jgi:tetratricopeptide (TPR) repeat protein
MLEEVYDLCPELHQGEVTQMAQDFEKDLSRQKIIERQDAETRKLMDIEGSYNNGVVAYKDGDFWLAVNFFEEALAIDPDRTDVKNALERAREQMRRQNAVKELDVSVEQHRPAIMEMYLNEAEPY